MVWGLYEGEKGNLVFMVLFFFVYLLWGWFAFWGLVSWGVLEFRLVRFGRPCLRVSFYISYVF